MHVSNVSGSARIHVVRRNMHQDQGLGSYAHACIKVKDDDHGYVIVHHLKDKVKLAQRARGLDPAGRTRLLVGT